MAKRICSVKDCGKPARTKGWCPTHYGRWWRTGSTELKTSTERFWEKVDASGDCWEWTASLTGFGYGQFGLGEKNIGAHRFAYEALVGPIPDGLELDHLCRNPPCVNPDHLEPVTHAENIRRSPSPPAKQARQTHCIRGHLFDEANTYTDKNGRRQCRSCHLMNQRKRYAAMRADRR